MLFYIIYANQIKIAVYTVYAENKPSINLQQNRTMKQKLNTTYLSSEDLLLGAKTQERNCKIRIMLAVNVESISKQFVSNLTDRIFLTSMIIQTLPIKRLTTHKFGNNRWDVFTRINGKTF